MYLIFNMVMLLMSMPLWFFTFCLTKKFMWYVLKFQMIARARAQGPFSDVCCINCSGSYGILNILAYVTESMKLESCFNPVICKIVLTLQVMETQFLYFHVLACMSGLHFRRDQKGYYKFKCLS